MRLIDADALADEMMKSSMPSHDIGGRYQTGFMDARSMVISAPTIDPVKRGKWIKIEGMSSDYYCSECEQKWWTPFPEEMHYCPNCGTSMEADE